MRDNLMRWSLAAGQDSVRPWLLPQSVLYEHDWRRSAANTIRSLRIVTLFPWAILGDNRPYKIWS